jgi:hypothetical protein
MRSFLVIGGAVLCLACSSSGDDGSTSNATSVANTTSSSSESSSTTSTGGNGGNGGATGGQSQGGAGGGNTACQWGSNTCGMGFYCNAPGCAMGTCEPIGTADDPNKAPVSGCDNVNYWNATTAARYGMSVGATGECAQGEYCGGFASLQCPAQGQFCGYIHASDLDCNISDGTGICWGMPEMCSQIGFGGDKRACFGNPTDPCLYECDAIKTQSDHWTDTSGCPM